MASTVKRKIWNENQGQKFEDMKFFPGHIFHIFPEGNISYNLTLYHIQELIQNFTVASNAPVHNGFIYLFMYPMLIGLSKKVNFFQNYRV